MLEIVSVATGLVLALNKDKTNRFWIGMTDKTVMVVDDVESNRVLLRMILEDDYHVVECEDGPSCLAAIEERIPDIVLLDINMPEMTGYEVCKRIRKNPNTSTLPVIFVSAMDTPEEKLAGFEAGGNDYLVKPVDAVALETKVTETLAQSKKDDADAEKTLETVKTTSKELNAESELGIILNFLTITQESESLYDIANECVNVANQFGFHAQFKIENSPPIYGNCKSDSVEAKVLDKFVSSKDKMICRGRRVLAKSEDFAIIINNMPDQDAVRYSRFKEHLKILTNICGGRVLSIKSQSSKLQHTSPVQSQSLEQACQVLSNEAQKLTEAVENQLTKIENFTTQLDIEAEQEEYLYQSINHLKEQLTTQSKTLLSMHTQLTQSNPRT